jgi:hypothetical protein
MKLKLKVQKKSMKQLSEDKAISQRLTPAVAGGTVNRLTDFWAFTCGRGHTCPEPH